MRRKSQYIDNSHFSGKIPGINSLSSNHTSEKSRSNPRGMMNKSQFLTPNASFVNEDSNDVIKHLTTIKDEEESISNISISPKNDNKKKNIGSKANEFMRTFNLSDQSQRFRLPKLPSSTKNKNTKAKKIFREDIYKVKNEEGKFKGTETVSSSVITSPHNLSKFSGDMNQATEEHQKHIFDQNKRFRDLQKGYRRQNKL
mmetsp:Transcript_24679/g.21909  ORF Transcript_24679/g.21909 Transcript_24679/m.21909 type:complete len:200 (-) Transcript_24679:25-624(-)